jgi:tetratricopeptide (TPR) repeat protein
MPRKIKQYKNPFLKAQEPLLALGSSTLPNLINAIALHQQGKLGQAEAIYRQLLKIKPRNPDVLYLLAVIASQTNNHQSAVDLIGLAIEINPNVAKYYSNRGNALKALKQFEAAVESYNKAIALKPDFAEAYSDRGIALKELKQFESAVSSYDNAIALKPEYAVAYYNRGNALKELKKLEASVASYDNAINLKSDFVEAYYNRGIALQELNQLDLAVSSYDKAINLKPEYDYLFGMRQHAKMHLCDWRDFEHNVLELSFKINNNARVSPCLPILALPI